MGRNLLKGALGDAPQPAADPGLAAVLLRPVLAVYAGKHRCVVRSSRRASNGLWLKIGLFRADCFLKLTKRISIKTLKAIFLWNVIQR